MDQPSPAVYVVYSSGSDTSSFDPHTKIEGWEPMEELDKIPICKIDPSKELQIGHERQQPIRGKVLEFLQQNLDVFAWNHEDIKCIDLKMTCHMLHMDPLAWPKQQKWGPLNFERYETLSQEVHKLLHNGFIYEAKYLHWVANPVLVKKNNGDRRVYIDFIDLNKVCSKDSFPVPRLDQMVDATTGHELLSFLDAYSEYN